MVLARRLVLALAIGFFCLPVALRVAGVHARPFENRPLAGKPALSEGWDAFDATTRFAVDRLPLREQGVRAHSWLALHVLDTSPTWRQELLADQRVTAALPAERAEQAPPPQAPAPATANPAPVNPVIVADDGWLLLRGELDQACSPKLPIDTLLRRMQELIQLLRQDGRQVAFLVAPDKTTIYPEHVPEDEPERACAERHRANRWPPLEQLREPSLVPMRRAVLAAKSRSSRLLYKRKDSHWNSVGAAVALEPVLAAFGHHVRVRPGELVSAAAERYTGDLTRLLGAPEEDTAPALTVQRRAESVLPGRTLLIRDSYGIALEPLLAPYLAELQTVPWSEGASAAEIAGSAPGARRVIVEVVERELSEQFATGGALRAVTEQLRAVLARRGGAAGVLPARRSR